MASRVIDLQAILQPIGFDNIRDLCHSKAIPESQEMSISLILHLLANISDLAKKVHFGRTKDLSTEFELMDLMDPECTFAFQPETIYYICYWAQKLMANQEELQELLDNLMSNMPELIYHINKPVAARFLNDIAGEIDFVAFLIYVRYLLGHSLARLDYEANNQLTEALITIFRRMKSKNLLKDFHALKRSSVWRGFMPSLYAINATLTSGTDPYLFYEILTEITYPHTKATFSYIQRGDAGDSLLIRLFNCAQFAGRHKDKFLEVFQWLMLDGFYPKRNIVLSILLSHVGSRKTMVAYLEAIIDLHPEVLVYFPVYYRLLQYMQVFCNRTGISAEKLCDKSMRDALQACVIPDDCLQEMLILRMILMGPLSDIIVNTALGILEDIARDRPEAAQPKEIAEDIVREQSEAIQPKEIIEGIPAAGSDQEKDALVDVIQVQTEAGTDQAKDALPDVIRVQSEAAADALVDVTDDWYDSDTETETESETDVEPEDADISRFWW